MTYTPENLADKLIVAAMGLINTIRAMQQKEPEWFGEFSTWEFDGTEADPTDMVTIEWPDLAISLKRLEDVIEQVKDLRLASQEALIAEITGKILKK